MTGDGMDEESRLAAAFRDAAGQAPPAGFDAGDVRAASRRLTRRRRSAVAGAALAVLAVAGVGVMAGLAGGPTATTPTGAGAPEAARAAAPDASAPSALAAPPGAAQDAASVPAEPGAPLGPGTRECADRQDPALRALLEQALPEVAGAPAAATSLECRPGGERGVALEVRDGRSAGVLSVTSLPAGTAVDGGGGARTAPTASGGTVAVTSRPSRFGDPQPFADRLDAVAASLGPRL